MSPIIRMETDSVQAVAQKLDQTALNIQQEVSVLGNSIRGLDWQGGAREQFINDFSHLEKNLNDLAEHGMLLARRARTEVDEWQQVDVQGGQNFASIVMIGYAGDVIWDGMRDAWWRNVQYGDYRKWWQDLSQQDKLNYLNEHQRKIAEKYGFDPMIITAEDLDDSNGDSRGENRGNLMVIDVDNLNNDDPWRVLETVAHESRHEYQEHVVDQYRVDGTVPEGMTGKQIEAWEKNFKDYKAPGDDFESYWGQAVENDARDFGDEYMNEVLDSRDWKDKS